MFRRFLTWARVHRQWHESNVIVDRKSRFQARHVPIEDASEVPTVVAEFLAEHKSIAKNASHPHIMAWRVGKPGELPEVKGRGARVQTNTVPLVVTDQGFRDNGEKGAGSRLLDVLVNNNVFNVLVIVTRWYGGSPIGGLRFRHIVNSAYDTLRKGKKL